MTDHIETAMEARAISRNLFLELANLPFNADLRKLLKNIDSMIVTLGALEVDARRGRRTHLFLEHREKVLHAIKHLEQLILIHRLMI